MFGLGNRVEVLITAGDYSEFLVGWRRYVRTPSEIGEESERSLF